jgi:hydrogenase large subunit
MKVEVTIDGGVVTTAKSVGTLFRGFETLMQGRHPWDAPVITARICGVCPVSHSNVSVMALDSAAGVTPPTNARLLRNLVLGSNYIQSHILHFYLLAAPDYVKMPASTPWVPSWSADINPTATVNLTGAI